MYAWLQYEGLLSEQKEMYEAETNKALREQERELTTSVVNKYSEQLRHHLEQQVEGVFGLCVCVYIFIKLHVTAQSGPVKCTAVRVTPRGSALRTVCVCFNPRSCFLLGVHQYTSRPNAACVAYPHVFSFFVGLPGLIKHMRMIG